MAKKKFKLGVVKGEYVFCGGHKYEITNGEFKEGNVKFKTVLVHIGQKPDGSYKKTLKAEVLSEA